MPAIPGYGVTFGCVTPGQSSVLNGVAGSPSLLKRLQVRIFGPGVAHSNGFATSALHTITRLPLISAFASRQTLSSPAMMKPFNSPPRASNPSPVCLKLSIDLAAFDLH